MKNEQAIEILESLKEQHEWDPAVIDDDDVMALNMAITEMMAKRPHGKWIRHIRSIECSVCKEKFFADDENENCQDYDPCTDFNYNFCPNCGADMREADNDK